MLFADLGRCAACEKTSRRPTGIAGFFDAFATSRTHQHYHYEGTQSKHRPGSLRSGMYFQRVRTIPLQKVRRYAHKNKRCLDIIKVMSRANVSTTWASQLQFVASLKHLRISIQSMQTFNIHVDLPSTPYFVFICLSIRPFQPPISGIYTVPRRCVTMSTMWRLAQTTHSSTW